MTYRLYNEELGFLHSTVYTSLDEAAKSCASKCRAHTVCACDDDGNYIRKMRYSFNKGEWFVPEFSLVGVDGNAFCIMAYVNEAMRKCDVPAIERNAYAREATSGDYDNLLAVSQKEIDLLNARFNN